MESPKTQEAKLSQLIPAHTGKRILVVDDDDFMRMAISFRLKEEGFLVITASDGAEALSLIRQQKEKLDLILLDLLMPHVSGFEFLNLIHTPPSLYKGIPIIIVSSLDHKHLLQEGYTLEGYLILEKPLCLDQLVVWVNHLLSFGEN